MASGKISLRLKTDEAKEILGDEYLRLQEAYDCTVVLQPFMPVLYGVTSDTLDSGDHIVEFGTGEIENSRRYIDDVIFTAALISIGHEKHHMDIRRLVLSGEANPSMSFNYLSGFGNPDYYNYSDAAYGSNVKEVESEYYGIRYAYDVLRTRYSEDKALTAIKKAVAYRASEMKGVYFCIDEFLDVDSVSSFDDITDTFQKAYSRALSYGSKKDDDTTYYGKARDNAYLYMRSDADVSAMFNDRRNLKLARDRIVAAIVVKTNSEVSTIFANNPHIAKLDIDAMKSDYLARKAAYAGLSAAAGNSVPDPEGMDDRMNTLDDG